MTKREFTEAFTRIRTAALREGYKDDPHGPACLAMSLVDLPKDCERIWRKHGPALRTMNVAELEPAITKAGEA